jgi:hypothetical protein
MISCRCRGMTTDGLRSLPVVLVELAVQGAAADSDPASGFGAVAAGFAERLDDQVAAPRRGPFAGTCPPIRGRSKAGCRAGPRRASGRRRFRGRRGAGRRGGGRSRAPSRNGGGGRDGGDGRWRDAGGRPRSRRPMVPVRQSTTACSTAAAEFADVAGPGVGLQGIQRLGTEAAEGFAVGLGRFGRNDAASSGMSERRSRRGGSRFRPRRGGSRGLRGTYRRGPFPGGRDWWR